MNIEVINKYKEHFKNKSDEELIIEMHSWVPNSERHIAAKIVLALRKEEAENNKDEKQLNNITGPNIWKNIKKEFGITKEGFGKKINFVKDKFCRKIIFRDIEQAYLLADTGFSKPSVFLSGSIIEELLRRYLIYKGVKIINNNFDSYIKLCKDKELLKSAISQLSDSVRQFRNIIHLDKEITKKLSIAKATAKGVFSAIFTIVNDF